MGTIIPLEYDPPEPGTAVEIAQGVLWARLPLSPPLKHVNVYAFADEDGWTVFDCGVDAPPVREAWAQLIAGPLAGRPIRRLIVSHHHPDHIGLAGWFQRQGVQLLTTRTAWLYARMLWLDEQALPSPEALAYWRFAGMPNEELATRAKTRPYNFRDMLAAMPLGFERINDGDLLTLAGRSFRVRLGQGHAPDQITLWQEDGPLVVIADQCLPSISPNVGVYPTEPDANPLEEFLLCCREFGALAHPEQLALPGHGRPFYGFDERMDALISEHEEGLTRIMEQLRDAPATAVECFRALYRRDIRPHEFGLALGEAIAHLNLLHGRGQVRRDLRDGVGYWRAESGV